MEPDSPFKVVCVSKLVGVFRGYRVGNFYCLENGDVWRQESKKLEYVDCENPGCRILADYRRYYIDVDGTSSVALVVRVSQSSRAAATSFRVPSWKGGECE
jgi:hypothetical protein